MNNMKKVILLTASYDGEPFEIVKGLVPDGFRLIKMATNSQDELVEKASSADYILASGKIKISKAVLNNAPKLKMIQRLGVGLDSLDFEALKNKNVPVYVNRGVNSNSVAEHALMFILASLRKLTVIDHNMKSGVWDKQEQGVTTRELATQTVGIIGSGNIGRKVAELLKPFGCKVLYYDPYRLSAETEKECNIVYMPLEDVFKHSDIITLHCPLTDETREVIREENLLIMKDEVIIVNTSRGGLINEKDLLQAIRIGKVGFAALDVYNDEPTRNNELVSNERVICTPHIAGNTYDSFRRMMQLAFRNIRLYDQGNLAEIEENKVSL